MWDVGELTWRRESWSPSLYRLNTKIWIFHRNEMQFMLNITTYSLYFLSLPYNDLETLMLLKFCLIPDRSTYHDQTLLATNDQVWTPYCHGWRVCHHCRGCSGSIYPVWSEFSKLLRLRLVSLSENWTIFIWLYQSIIKLFMFSLWKKKILGVYIYM